MKVVLASLAVILLANSPAAAQQWKAGSSAAERSANGTTCRIWASRGEQGWYGQVNASTPNYRLIMMITDGSEGRDIINTVDVTSVQPRASQTFRVYTPQTRTLARQILTDSCSLENLSGPAAEVLKIAQGY